METGTKTEWVATVAKNGSTLKIAYRNARALAAGLADQTAGGWVAVSVIERTRETYTD